ncbi:MAG: hypothetical protein JNL50_09260 [Phycisphaerae bacterium]|nr:hypothetical protein [Phycisphaerae bacterium]
MLERIGRPRVWAGLAVGALALGVGVAAYAWPGSRTSAPSAKQRAAAELAYPDSSGPLPEAITVTYDAGKNRTQMCAELAALSASAPAGYRLSTATMRVRSEFTGERRREDRGELSVRVDLLIESSPPGALAPSSPVAELNVNGKVLAARGASDGSSGYEPAKGRGGRGESLEFRVSTKDLIELASSKAASLKAGVVSVQLSAREIAVLREFAARMNPRLVGAKP